MPNIKKNKKNALGVLFAIAIIKKYECTDKKWVKGVRLCKRIWSRKWLLRRYSRKDMKHIAIKGLQLENPKSFINFIRMSKG